MPNLLTPQDLEPNWEWRDKLPAHGHMSVDSESRIDHDSLRRYCLLTRDDSPYVWDFGSAAQHHKRHSDGLGPDHCLAGIVGMRGTVPPEFGLMQKYAKEIAHLIKEAGMADMPVGLDYVETAMFHALQKEGLNVVAASRSICPRARSRTVPKSSF